MTERPKHIGGNELNNLGVENPFNELAETGNVYAAAKLLMDIHLAHKSRATLTDPDKGFPIIESYMDELEARKKALFSEMSEHEIEMAMYHARLAQGPYEGPEVDDADDTQIYEIDNQEEAI